MFRIAEEYIKTIKTNPDEKYFFILAKIDFQNFNFLKCNQKKSKFQKIENFKIILTILVFEIFDFSDFFLKILIFGNFGNFENLKILKINFLRDEKIFFVRILFYCIDIFFRNPKHIFRVPMIPSERCYSA